MGLPTETVYGLAGVATNEVAVACIFSAKERPSFDPLIVHVHETDLRFHADSGLIDIALLGSKARERARILCEKFWPGPLTLVLPVGPRVPGIVTSGLDTVALRSPRHPDFRAVLAELGSPLAAPSANRFGQVSPTRAGHVVDELDGRIPFVLDGGPSHVGVESTVLRIEPEGQVTLLRTGATPIESIETAIDEPCMTPSKEDLSSPGRLKSHYSPATPLYLLPQALEDLDASRAAELTQRLDITQPIGLILFDECSGRTAGQIEKMFGRSVVVSVASATHDDREAARNLFRVMRELDRSKVVAILSEPVHRKDGLWPAIAERLLRAAS